MIWWKCSKGSDHVWQATPNQQVNENAATCPFCSNQRQSITNSLATCYPDIAREFHPLLNGISASDVKYGTRESVWWQCERNLEHEWRAPVVARTINKTGCPWCQSKGHSRVETLISYELAFVLGFDPTKHKLRIAGRIRDVDVLCHHLKLIIEFDGSYYHKGREADDQKKTRLLELQGWKVLRIREEPLEPLAESDIQVPVVRHHKDSTIKEAVDAVLRRLVEIEIAVPRDAVRRYLRRKTLANRKQGDKAIEDWLASRFS